VARKERYWSGCDVGTSKVTAVVGEVMDEGQLDVIGVGLAESRGIKRGTCGQPRSRQVDSNQARDRGRPS